jgi:cell division protein FtsQ
LPGRARVPLTSEPALTEPSLTPEWDEDEMDEPEEPTDTGAGRVRLGSRRRDGSRADWSKRSWWQPASGLGRALLLTAVLLPVGALATGAYLLKCYLDTDSRYRIAGAGNIQAAGLTEVSRAEMLPVFGEDIGRNIFFVPLAERKKQLEEIPWVERATVMRLYPDQIRVSVVEREPVAFVRQGQQIGLVDANGVLLTMPAAMMAQRHYSFPVVTGLDAQQTPEARKARMAAYQRLLGELDANGQKLSAQISEIDLTDPADARVLMPEQGGDILAHFGEDHYLERYQRYKAHIGEWRQQYPKLAAVDLRYDQKVVLEMAQTGGDGTDGAASGDAAQLNPAAANGDGATTTAKPEAKPEVKATAKSETKPAAKVAPATEAKAKPGVKLVLAAHAAAGKPSTKPAAKAVKASAKAASGNAKTASAKSKNAAAEKKAKAQKAAQEKKAKDKKSAEAKRAALKVSKSKSAPAAHAAAATGEGQ